MALEDGLWIPRIADFGLVATQDASTRLSSGEFLGTASYAAPEQWRGMKASELDGRTDLYALGGLLYRMLTGQTPFHADSLPGWSAQHCNVLPAPPSSHRPNLAHYPGLDALVLALLEKNRDHRPRNAEEAIARLDTIVESPAPEPGRETSASTIRETLAEPPAPTPAALDPAASFRPSPGPVSDLLLPRSAPAPRKSALRSWRTLTWAVPITAALIVSAGLSTYLLRRPQPAALPQSVPNPASLVQSPPRVLPLLRTLTGHSGPVNSVAFSRDGRTLASGSADKTIGLWNPDTGQWLGTLIGHTGGVNSVAFSPDGRILASASDDRTVRLWNPATGQLLRALTGHSAPVNSVAFSPDGRILASGSDDKTIRLWDPVTGQRLRTLTGHARGVNSIAFSPDGRILASASNDETVRLWNPATGQLLRILTGHSASVTSVVFSPNGLTVASGSDDSTVRIWDPASRQVLRILTATDVVESIALTRDGDTLAAGGAQNLASGAVGIIRLWNPSTGEIRYRIAGNPGGVSSIAFRPDGATLAAGTQNKTISLWELPAPPADAVIRER